MKMKTIAVANQKGGVGKTTTAVNLSACLAAAGWRVLLLDLDPQANATSSLGFENMEGLSAYHAFVGEVKLSERVLPTRLDNLFLIPSDLDLAGSEIEVARLDDHLIRLRQIMQPLRDDSPFDFIIMDCPPSLGILMTNALAAADELLVPIQCEYFALEGLSKIVRLTEQIRESGANPGLSIGGIVMTMYDSRTNLSQQVVNEVRKHFEAITYHTAIPRTVRLGEAPSFGKTILEYDPNGIGALFYRRLAEEFIQRQRGEKIAPEKAPVQEEIKPRLKRPGLLASLPQFPGEDREI
jgi:chromosome partitioning protein